MSMSKKVLFLSFGLALACASLYAGISVPFFKKVFFILFLAGGLISAVVLFLPTKRPGDYSSGHFDISDSFIAERKRAWVDEEKSQKENSSKSMRDVDYLFGKNPITGAWN